MGKRLIICVGLAVFFCSTIALASGSKKEKVDPEKEEYIRQMKSIDKSYKRMQDFMGFYPDQLGKEQWNMFLTGGQNIANVTQKLIEKYSRPDDETYEKLMKDMRKHAQAVVKAAKKRYLGAYEDIQYSHGRMRNACKRCHNHLNIQIYTGLYPPKEKELPPPPPD